MSHILIIVLTFAPSLTPFSNCGLSPLLLNLYEEELGNIAKDIKICAVPVDNIHFGKADKLDGGRPR